MIFYYFTWRCFKISTKENLINEEIKIPEVRLVGNDGEMLGIVKIAKAHELAAEKDLDEGVLLALERTIAHLQEEGFAVCEDSVRARAFLLSERKSS